MLFKIIIASIAYFIIGGMVETFCGIWQRDHDIWENTIIFNEDSTGERVSVIIFWPLLAVVFLCIYIPLTFGKIGSYIFAIVYGIIEAIRGPKHD